MSSDSLGYKGSGIKAIPTTFKGIEFKSRFEAEVAMLLDKMGLEWQYEPKSFLLPSGHYMPDFYVESIGLWIEARGYDSKDWQIEQFSEHVKTTNGEYIVFKADTNHYVSKYVDGRYVIDSQKSYLHIGNCKDCGIGTFLSFDALGRPCPKCGEVLYQNSVGKAFSQKGKIFVQDAFGDYPVAGWPGFDKKNLDLVSILIEERKTADIAPLASGFYKHAFEQIKRYEEELNQKKGGLDEQLLQDTMRSERICLTKIIDLRIKKVVRKAIKSQRAAADANMSGVTPEELELYNRFKDLLTATRESILSTARRD